MKQGVLPFLLLVSMWLWMVQCHVEKVDRPALEVKAKLHADVLANRAPDPYEYKMWAVSHVLEAAHRWTGAPMDTVFFVNSGAALALLVLLHHLWLRALFDPLPALVGSLGLGALASTLFLTYFHQPQDLWGVALYCSLLTGLVRGWDWRRLSLLALVTGVVWEKHAMLPVLWGLWRWRVDRERFLPTFLRGLVFLAASLAPFVAVRLLLGTDREHVDGFTTLFVGEHPQEWDKVLWYQLPYVVPFAAILVARWRDVPGWVRLLWVQVSALFGLYVAQGLILHEVRSFWALAPVFTATLAAWVASWIDAGVAPRPGDPVSA